MLEKVISGGQTGADQAGLFTAKRFGIKTGGYAPKRWMTSEGENPSLKYKYGLVESAGSGYKSRTWDNVLVSDGTIRLAFRFDSPGEVCTLDAIKRYKKPFFDVNLYSKPEHLKCSEWIIMNDIKILNIAGNSETGNNKVFLSVENYLTEVFRILTTQNFIKRIGE